MISTQRAAGSLLVARALVVEVIGVEIFHAVGCPMNVDGFCIYLTLLQLLAQHRPFW